MTVQIAVPGSCGELVQGRFDDINFHITCPISKYSQVTASLLNNREIRVEEGLIKTQQAAIKSLESIGTNCGAEIFVQSDLPMGKGMASSTADIAAAIAAIHGLFDLGVDASKMAEIALSIEPTDGTFFEGIVAFDHLKGQMLQRIGCAPPVEIIVLEPPKSIDTVAFNRQKQSIEIAEEHFYKEIYEMATESIKYVDLRLLGEAATLSSTLNQKVLFKPALADIIDTCRRKGALGVNIAHSGTVMGILVEQGFGRALYEKISHYIPRYWDAYVVDMVDGGVQRHNIIEGLFQRVPINEKNAF